MRLSHLKTILCVDDEFTGLSVRKMILESQGYRVLAADNGEDALSLFAKERLDLVVLDYAMQGMNGGQVAEQMRRLKPMIPIVMLSAYVNLPSATQSLVDKIVTKGEPPLVLLEAISNLLRKNERDRSRSTA